MTVLSVMESGNDKENKNVSMGEASNESSKVDNNADAFVPNPYAAVAHNLSHHHFYHPYKMYQRSLDANKHGSRLLSPMGHGSTSGLPVTTSREGTESNDVLIPRTVKSNAPRKSRNGGSRVPLKKRFPSPVPPPVPQDSAPQTTANNQGLLLHPLSHFLGQTPSAFGLYQHQDILVQSQIGRASNRDLHLLSEPLLGTPGTFLWTPPDENFGDFTPDTFTPGVFSRPVVVKSPQYIVQPSHGKNIRSQAPPPKAIPSHKDLSTDDDWCKRKTANEKKPLFSKKPCKCANTHCLKLYCECFRHGFFCDPNLCRCKDCFNNEAHNEPRGARQTAINRILARRPDAFTVQVKRRKGNGCACKKSG